MTVGFYKHIEQIIKSENALALQHLEYYWGIELKIYKPVKDKHSRAYGRESGTIDTNAVTITGIVVNNDVIPIDDIHAGAFSNGLLYTTSKEEVNAGDLVEIVSDDNRVRRFKVMEKQAFGQTTNVFTQYSLAAIGD